MCNSPAKNDSFLSNRQEYSTQFVRLKEDSKKYFKGRESGVTQLRQYLPIAIITIVVIVLVSALVDIEMNAWKGFHYHQDKQTLEDFQEIFPEAQYYLYDEESGIYTLYDPYRNKTGYIFYAEGISYDGPITGEGSKIGASMVIMVGIENKDVIRDIIVVSHEETPPFWELLIKREYFNQFVGLKIEDAYFTYDGGNVNCITSATLSSEAVMDIVRNTAIEKIKLIRD